jgi:hypothetical protein
MTPTLWFLSGAIAMWFFLFVRGLIVGNDKPMGKIKETDEFGMYK